MKIGQIVRSFENNDTSAQFQTKKSIGAGYHVNDIQLGATDTIVTIDAAIVPLNNNGDDAVFKKDITYVIDFEYSVDAIALDYGENVKDKNTEEKVDFIKQEMQKYSTTTNNEYNVFSENAQLSGTWTGKVLLADLDHDYTMTLSSIPTISPNMVRRLKLIFTPNRDYNQILIKLDRVDLRDFFVVDGDRDNTIPCFKIQTKRDSGELQYPACFELKNLLEKMNIKRLGIQGFEGMSFAIDGEDFEMGRSGFFSLEDVNISKLACYVPPTGVEEHLFDPADRRKFFIVDYEKY